MPFIAKLDLDSRSYDQKLAQSAAKTEAAAKRMESGVKQAGAAVTDSFGTRMKAGAAMLMGALGIGGVLGTIMKIKQYMTSLVTSTDMTSKMSRNLGITGEQLQGLQYAARSAGMEVDAIPTAFARMKKEAGSALNGEQASIEKFNRIGISMEKLKGKKPWEVFEITAEAINAIQDPVEKTNAGMDIFGKSFDKMQNFLRDYKGSIDNLQGQGIITEDQLQAAEQLTQRIEDLKTALNALVVNSGFIESIKEVVEGLDAWLNMTQKLKKAGVITREQAVDEAISKAEASGKYSDDELEGMKEVKKSYGMGVPLRGWGIYGVSNAYAGTYKNLDKALEEANPLYKRLGRDAEGNFLGTGEMTMPISGADASVEKTRRAEAERKRLADAAERAKVQEEYKNRLITKQVEQYKFQYDYQKLILDGKYKEAEALKNNYELSKGTAHLSEEAKKKISEYASATNDLEMKKYLQDLQDQVQLQTYLVNKEYEKYAVLKMQLDLKGKQKEANEAEKKQILAAADAMNKLNLKQSLTEQGRNLVYDAMKKAGLSKEADRQKALDEAEKKRGAKLTENERNYVLSLADLSGQLSAVTQPDLKGLEIRTNELTARGGFSTGAVVPDKDAVNKKIAENQKTTNDLLTQIKLAVQRLEEVPL